VENGNLELVNCLLPVADVNAKTGNGSTALHLAALLSKANRIENDYEKKRLQMDFLSITRLLLRIPGIIIDCKNNIGVTPLYFAVDKGTEAVAKELLRRFLQYPSFLVDISTLVEGHGHVFLLFYLKKIKSFQKKPIWINTPTSCILRILLKYGFCKQNPYFSTSFTSMQFQKVPMLCLTRTGIPRFPWFQFPRFSI
jgi:hypothetical protein